MLTGDLVDGISDGKQLKSLGVICASFLLEQSNYECSRVISITLVSVDHSHTVLRVSPERVCRYSRYIHHVHASVKC